MSVSEAAAHIAGDAFPGTGTGDERTAMSICSGAAGICGPVAGPHELRQSYPLRIDSKDVPEYNTLYDLYNLLTMLRSSRNKYLMIHLRLGEHKNDNFDWAVNGKQDLIDSSDTI